MISIPQNWLHPGILRHGARLLRGHGPRHRDDLPYQDTGPRLHRGVSAWTLIEYLSCSSCRINKQLDEEEAALKAIRQDEIDACLAQVLGYRLFL